MRAILSFFLRNGLLYLILFAAIAFYVFAWPAVEREASSGALGQDTMGVAEVRAQFAEYREGQERRLDATKADIAGKNAQEIAERLAAAKRAREAKVRQRAGGGGWLDSVRPSKIVAAKRLQVEIAALDIEIAALSAAQDRRTADAALAKFRRIPTADAVRVSERLCTQARDALTEFESRNGISRAARNIVYWEGRTLLQRRTARCTEAQARKTRREAGLAARDAAQRAKDAVAQAQSLTLPGAEELTEDLPDRALRDIAVTAAFALLFILAIPFLIRLFFWFVLAPFAERREAIRMNVPGGMGDEPIGVTAQSSVSVGVTLEPGEELLVRQGFLQTSPHDAVKATQFLLDWRHPLSSLASGLRFLTRLRGDGSATTVSAAHDPFAEVTLLTLPDGASCVLQPRALAAVVQRQGDPLRITSHWRLTSLHAWLTLQLRYLVFHGPVRLVIMGRRGVRAEPADTGRIFAPDQLVGFSANLGYATRRNETFWPYFTGREPLLRDRITGGKGVLLLEETPSAGSGKGGIRRGLEGTVDAMLKAFGI